MWLALLVAAAQPAQLPCFPCHSRITWASGPKFPHAKAAHKGHCHECHVNAGHRGWQLDKSSCVKCHDDK